MTDTQKTERKSYRLTFEERSFQFWPQGGGDTTYGLRWQRTEYSTGERKTEVMLYKHEGSDCTCLYSDTANAKALTAATAKKLFAVMLEKHEESLAVVRESIELEVAQ